MGVFIYKTKGSFPNNFIIEAIDVLLMAKGSSAEVGYKTDGQLIGDLCDLEYDEYSRALIHSHNNMSTSFSGTDYEQLKLGASTGPYYLSVVVNNNMEFTAKVAIKSTEKYKGYSYFKNLSGKEIKTSKELTKESFEIIDVKVEAIFPQYMIDVDKRIKDRLQNYITPHIHTPVGSGNKIHNVQKPGSSYYGDYYNGYHDNDYYSNKYDERTYYKQGELFTLPKPVLTAEEDLDEFIEEALKKYCHYSYTNETCALNIVEDKDHYGIPINEYIEYLEINPLFTNVDRDEEFLKLLKEYTINGK